MNNLKSGILIGIALCYATGYAQTGNLTSSPYSLFGLGKQNEVGSGKTNALGKSGIALGSETEINSLNPASLATIPKNAVFFDIGIKNENSRYVGSRDEKSNNISNFSNISMALAFDEKSGIGFSLFPYTNVGYNIAAVSGTVEGTSDLYTSNVIGSGGLNNFQLNYGRKITARLNLGARVNYYFGKINEVETVDVQGDNLIIDEDHRYKGIQFSLGGQYKLADNLGLGLLVNLPTSLSASKEQTVSSVIGGLESEIETSEQSNMDSFRIPAEIGIGAKYTYKAFTFNADYKVGFWKGTNEEDTSIGKFTNQQFLGGGVEYFRGGRNFLDRTRFRMGGNYDTGFMSVQGSKIKNVALTAGIGLPLGIRGNTLLNLSYSYGQRGQVSNTLIRENYHLISINLSLEEIWFAKRLFD
ncbi:hypothetical protein AAEO56_01010 [Flavobacterium sp. DGU11]|uniref:Long-chain fatty acid transport protein n=1 Tax=Flavobacterium arundinis TaxID=3139143 RepID=A0ABU9HRN4_9FLAO